MGQGVGGALASHEAHGRQPMRYFDLIHDVSLPGRWDLDNPTDPRGQEVDPWQFTEGRPVEVAERLTIPVSAEGRPLDFSWAGFSIPIVSARAASIFTTLAPRDVQFLPVTVPGHPEPFYLLVCTRVVKCIDDERSTEVRYWKPEDGRPERVGHYRSVYRLRIDPAKVGEARIFRTWGWLEALIVSEDIKEALERLGAVGPKFKEV
ncbi:MAG TPA: DUF1629 domain-containing protein [Archangium sp.]|nr:DUF1629 domain-containing protein [Archangium sp.]